MRNALYAASLIIGALLFSSGYPQSVVAENGTASLAESPHRVGNTPTGTAAVPLSLRTAIQIGLENNPEIRSSGEKVKAAHGRRLSAVSPSPAELSVAGDYIPKGRHLGNYGERTVGVSQTIEFPTNYLLRASKYSIEKKIAENESELVKLGVVSNVKKAYFTVCALLAQVTIARENLGIADDFLRKAEVRHSVGEGTSLEKLTAKAGVTEAKNNVAIMQSHLSTAYSELNYCMGYGRGVSTTYHPVDSLCFITYDVAFDELLETALSAHPLLNENRLLVRSGNVDKTLAVSAMLPEFTVGIFDQKISGDATKYYGASLSLGIPLWFMMDQRGKILEASANEAAAQADLKAVDNAMYTKISAAFTEFAHEENQVRLYLDEILPQAAAIYRTAAKNYEAGEISYIEFLQAQQTLINSKCRYTEALLSYNLSIVALEDAVGTTLK